MGKPRIFIDGHVGTTGLRIRELLAARDDLELISLASEERKDSEARRTAFRSADMGVLCLPDDAAQEAARWIALDGLRILDASSAHRVDPDWTFGLPELEPDRRTKIRHAARVSNPGCYSSAMLLGIRPLIDAGLLTRETPLTIHALSGYSGGGRRLIERWEDPDRGLLMLPFETPYALDQIHKHVAEMQHYSGLARPPQFIPAVGPFRDGMRLEIPLHASILPKGVTGETIWKALMTRYREEAFIRVVDYRVPLAVDEMSFDPRACNGTNRLEIAVVPHPAGHVLLIVRLDNLGKGASGVAVQNLNLMLGIPEETGLVA